ncbi:MAG TPA: hypothetical protein VM370_13665 [Candidatus Thermoplasmatota archaeon]|nr:hypothetical protein [Candidatus Thermoplasmatota archaeon]
MAAAKKPITGLSAEEKAAMKALLHERKAAKTKEAGEKAALAAIAAMSPRDRALAQKLHEIVGKAAPSLRAKTWYGFPAYANEEDEVVVFFKPADKFKERYATLGFNTPAKLDEGQMWPTSYAWLKPTGGDEARIAALVKKAVG